MSARTSVPGVQQKRFEAYLDSLAPDNVRRMHQSAHHLVADAPWSGEPVLEQVRSLVLLAMEKQGPVAAWSVSLPGA